MAPLPISQLALLLLWLKGSPHPILNRAWLVTLAITTLIGLTQGLLEPNALVVMFIAGTLAWIANNSKIQTPARWFAGFAFIAAAVLFGMHRMPGFHSLIVFNNVILSQSALPYSLYLNIDKPLVGLFILGLWYQRPARVQSWTNTGITILITLPLILATVFTLAILVNFIHFEPKLVDQLWLWAWVNLLFTCTAEEALFRGLIQHQLAKMLSSFAQ